MTAAASAVGAASGHHRGASEGLRVEGLHVAFRTERGMTPVVTGVNVAVAPGQTLGLVGESGCGKSVTALAIMGLVPDPPGRVTAGRVLLGGRDLLALPAGGMADVRGREIAMVFQEPMTSLDPVFTVGDQIAEVLRRHQGIGRRAALARAVELLDLVGIPQAGRRVGEYPHALSGGMRQRALIAIAIACEPQVLIADEPTTALDVTTQAQILDLLRDLQDELGMATVFITHDLGVVADICDDVAVMYAGQVVEQGRAEDVFYRPQHPYTEALLGSIPSERIDVPLVTIPGTVPPPHAWPAGCRFHPRCSHGQQECTVGEPELAVVGLGHTTRCVRASELELTGVAP